MFAALRRWISLFNIRYSLFIMLCACTSADPVLPGKRIPIFKSDAVVIQDKKITDFGTPLVSQSCALTIDESNRIWHGKVQIFAGLPTNSEIASDRRVMCQGNFVYAGLSTGELVKINIKTHKLIWKADIFAENNPTGGSPFLDILATPVYNGGFVYAGGMGDAFCKIKDSNGVKVWCIPISVQDILQSTKDYNVVLLANGEKLVIDTNGKAYNIVSNY